MDQRVRTPLRRVFPASTLSFCLLVILPGFALAQTALPSIAQLSGAACRGGGVGGLVVSPRKPGLGSELRFLATFPEPKTASLVVFDDAGIEVGRSEERRGGPPFWWQLTLRAKAPGTYRGVLLAGAQILACGDVSIGGGSVSAPANVYWPAERGWDQAGEDLYAAWVERLFDDPLDEQPSWRSLHALTRDPERNLLFNHLGLGEDDEGGLLLEPDCADLPYFLRGYFAWKLRLPFGYSTCGSGRGDQPPFCETWHSNADAPKVSGGDLKRMQRFFAREVAWTVHSAGGRTAPEAERSDYYPVELNETSLRPGTVFVDPYGHVLIIARRLPQTEESSGRLLAVDAQPDGTVARKSYWRGNFLFSVDPSLGGAGFKRFRPVGVEDGKPFPVSNDKIAEIPFYADFSTVQYEHGVDGFYERVDRVLSPKPRDALQVFTELISALDEQVNTRVRSVANGEDYVREHRGTVSMPKGAAIFQTTGAWEDFATPARDLRLLIAIDVVRNFPERVVANPERYLLPKDLGAADLRMHLDEILKREAEARSFRYLGSDGEAVRLTLADVLARVEALEMAYNPNDCVEIRWGAAPDSDEMQHCRRHAPAEQRRRMASYREWFRDRRRP